MYELNRRDSFKKEVGNLVQQLDKRIENFSQEIALESRKVNTNEAADMNTLKLHRYKMKDLMIALEEMSDETWRANRWTFQQGFKEAEKTLAITP